MELIQQKKQDIWGWSGAANFILGGMGTGFYLVNSLIVLLQSQGLNTDTPRGFKLVAAMLVGFGFLSLTLEAGWPLRSYHLLRHMRYSWMSREVLMGLIFMASAAADWLFPHPLLWGLGLISAVGLMLTHGLIVYRVKAIVPWHIPLIPLFFLTSGLVTGGGLMLITIRGQSHTLTTLIVQALVFVDLILWLGYLYGAQHPEFRQATLDLRSSRALILTVGLGHILPILLLIPTALGQTTSSGLARFLQILAGLLILIDGVELKASLVFKAGYMRRIILGQLDSGPSNQGSGVGKPQSPLSQG